ncbi:hypothetical protein OKW21_003752 [Catalinimonas alkaloidigena]|uniref:hypothetical protein n=1 Tax=Catalinimonas alkaloidigena TaxID=1075417 RepID=UPI002404E5A5|nr:hypothetical protein [Catalinimonas alkaloidigena]MDF9798489.1 hypothetical protein [Catalinimonas alkaloidigena]
MKVLLVLITSTILTVAGGQAQTKQHYHVLPVDEQQVVRLEMNAPSVSCRINSTYNMRAVSIYGYPENQDFNPIVFNKVSNNEHLVKLKFEDPTENFTSSISSRVFKQLNDGSDKPWHVYLSRGIPFDLDLHYGMGNSSVDLSGLSVENFKISTGSADVKVGYFDNVSNRIPMDTFYAKVDMGVLELDQINLSRAREVVADVGFGRLMVHFSEQIAEKSNIKASVGAGSMIVLLDDPDIPLIVYINNSPLCRIKMLKQFEEIEPNVYVNQSYDENAKNLISFDIDVAMGNVIFRMNE